MKIELINDHYKKIPEPFKKKEIKKLIDVVLKKIGFEELENGQINIKYTSEEEIKMLNEKFYNKVGVTNVLAFTNNQKTPESKERLIGEIAICISQINIKYTSEEEIKMLNEKFYNKVGVTNVLAFTNNQETPESKERLIGEIAICISQIEKEAKMYKKAVETRLKHMIVHGVLHLFGFDHQQKGEQKEMEQVEDDIITSCLGERPY